MGELRLFIGVFYFIVTVSICSYSVCSNETSAPQPKTIPVNNNCLDCICKAISNCDKSKPYCKKDVCGMFRMTQPFWEDGGTLKIDGSRTVPSDNLAYQACANDEKCARQTVYNYLTRYARDCDGNGVVDCLDYAGIHKWGPFGCENPPSDGYEEYYTALKTCLSCGEN